MAEISLPAPSAEPSASPPAAEGAGLSSPAKEKSPVAALPKLSAKEAGRRAQAAQESENSPDKAKFGTDDAAEPGAPDEKTAKSPDKDTQRARDLVKAGDLQGAMKAIGLDATKLGEGWAKQKRYFDNVAARVIEAQKAADEKEKEVRSIAEKLVKDHEGYANARKLYDEGEYEEAFKLAFGEEMHEFQKKAFSKLANPTLGKDPTVLALRKEIEDLRKEREEEKRKALEQEEVRTIEQKRAEYRKELAAELAALDDTAIAAGAEDPEFVTEVFEEQRKAYDRRTGQTLSPQEAAEKVIERYRAVAERARKFSGQSVPQTDTGSPAAPSGTSPGKSAPSPAKPTSLNAKEASEAASTPKLRGRDLIEYHVRRASQQA